MKAEGLDDTLHHFWDFTGKPTLTLVLTETNATVTFNWQRINFGQDQGIIIDSPIKYIYSLVVDKVMFKELKKKCLEGKRRLGISVISKKSTVVTK